MNLRKAAEMALEIIEGEWPADDEIASPVMYALREALAQPEQEPVAWMMFGVDKPTRVILHKPSDEHKKVFSCIFPLYTHEEALAKPEQEPVAWIFDKQFLLHEADATTFKESPELYIPLYLHPASATPEGWQLVPKNPTEEMRDAGYWAIRINGGEGDDDVVTQDALKAYEAMLAAAPEYKP